MTILQPVGPNAEQIHYWNALAAPKWLALQEFIDAQVLPLGLRALERAAIAPGERVLDVGCGCGATTLEIARRVGPTGSVTGVDVATAMLERARQHTREAGLAQARFENADAQTYPFASGSFDVLFSRFGVMFFVDPIAAFANLRAALRPGGRVVFICWQALPRNPWMFVPLSAALQHVPPPPPPTADAPGPFAFADAERVREILSRAGFTELGCESLQETLTIGDGNLDQAAGFLVQMGPTGHLLRAATAEVRSRVAGAVRDALSPFLTPTGVRLGAAAWIVTGHRA
jgi:SAM-dependent methyltransferase